jgi:hypothetical protein
MLGAQLLLPAPSCPAARRPFAAQQRGGITHRVLANPALGLAGEEPSTSSSGVVAQPRVSQYVRQAPVTSTPPSISSTGTLRPDPEWFPAWMQYRKREDNYVFWQDKFMRSSLDIPGEPAPHQGIAAARTCLAPGSTRRPGAWKGADCRHRLPHRSPRLPAHAPPARAAAAEIEKRWTVFSSLWWLVMEFKYFGTPPALRYLVYLAKRAVMQRVYEAHKALVLWQCKLDAYLAGRARQQAAGASSSSSSSSEADTGAAASSSGGAGAGASFSRAMALRRLHWKNSPLAELLYYVNIAKTGRVHLLPPVSQRMSRPTFFWLF